MSNSEIHKTAILFFSRSANAEASLKPFSAKIHFSAKRKLAASLINQTKKVLAKSNLPLFSSDEKSQEGVTFGERISSSIAKIFDKGFHNVLVIGNDCPNINLKDISESVLALENNESIIGPAIDGGVYLFGIQKNNFSEAEFTQLPWQTSQLASGFSILIESKKSVLKFLATKADIDQLQAISQNTIQKSPIEIAKILHSLLASFIPYFQKSTCFFHSPALNQIPFFRGPPVIFF